MTEDPRVTAYIAAAQPFARPLLAEIRRRMHAAAPGIVEDIKWRMPTFVWKGRQVANMAAFKAHCALSFWHLEASSVDKGPKEGMGQFGRLTSLADLPDEEAFAEMVGQAVALVEAGVKASPFQKHDKAPIAMPDDFAASLDSAGVRDRFNAMPPGAQREYLEWITTARQAATRARRIAQATDQIAEDKKLHWKYEAG
ncbi:MAG: YdeI/OmpD-associated family protein [Thermaurantiacus sp.]